MEIALSLPLLLLLKRLNDRFYEVPGHVKKTISGRMIDEMPFGGVFQCAFKVKLKILFHLCHAFN